MILFPIFKMGRTCTHVDASGRTEITCRLKDIALLTVMERDSFHIVKRELPEVNLPVLSIAELNTVVAYSGMVGAHGADVDSFQAAYPAIILDLYSGEITQRISHTQAVETPQFLTAEPLHRYNLLFRIACDHHHLL